MTRRKQIVVAVAGVLVFGFLMGIRDEFHSLWIRAGVAGVAGAVFGLTIGWCVAVRRQESRNR